MKRILAIVFVLIVASLIVINRQQAKTFTGDKNKDFSFIAFGDNRLPGHLPYSKEETNKINEFFEQVKEYAYGPDVKIQADMGFDPETNKLAWFKIWPEMFPEKYSIMMLKNGWPQLMVRGIPPQVALRSEGQAWVYENMLREIDQGIKTPDGPQFCLSTGDLTYNGYQGKTRDESPYWSDFYQRFLKRLPVGSPEGLPARFFAAPGNHESWADGGLEGFISTFPYLSELGFTRDNRIYMFDHNGCRFIFLDTGDMDYHNPEAWGGKHPDFQGQMKMLTKWLKEAKNKKSRHVFITYHNPSFCRAGFGPLPDRHNPHSYIKPFGGKLDITVLTGHVHTTEIYKVDGIRYLVLGAGGGEQGYIVNEMPQDYPEELYWRGNPRVEDYNYLTVKVSGKGARFFLKRFRPTEQKKYGEIELYPTSTVCGPE
jgi:hypothetical protein